MSNTPIAEEQIKELFKQAIFEVLQERKDWFYDLFAEVIEDFALGRAIREGETEETVSREEVFRTLKSAG
jgi:hypothetical protein